MARLKYNGKLSEVEVGNYGSFSPGTEKTVDAITAAAFSDPRCAEEGWEVINDDDRTKDDTPRVNNETDVAWSPLDGQKE